jgi:hypothetical protein
MNKFISFRDFFLTEGFNIKDKDIWETLYHEMFMDNVQRALVPTNERDKEVIKGMKPGLSVSGPTMQVDFYEITSKITNSRRVVFVERPIWDQYPGNTFTLPDYDMETLEDWWKENWKELTDYMDKGHVPEYLNPPDPADMWKHKEDKPDPKELVSKLKSSIENLEPATDARELYWDAIDAGLTDEDKEVLEADIDHYVKTDYLSKEEAEYIRTKPDNPYEGMIG